MKRSQLNLVKIKNNFEENKEIKRNVDFIRYPRSSTDDSFINKSSENISFGTSGPPVFTPSMSWTEALDGDVGFQCLCDFRHSGRYCEWFEPQNSVGFILSPEIVMILLVTIAFLGKFIFNRQ